MDLGGVRRKMARKNCDRINAVKTVNSYVFFKRWYAVRQRFFSTVRKLYIDAYCIIQLVELCLDNKLNSNIASEIHSCQLLKKIYWKPHPLPDHRPVIAVPNPNTTPVSTELNICFASMVKGSVSKELASHTCQLSRDSPRFLKCVPQKLL